VSLKQAIWRAVKHSLLLQDNGHVQITCRLVAACFRCIIELREMVTVSKNGSTEHSKGNKTVAGKVATTRTEDGHK
jgi:hypothetical protein